MANRRLRPGPWTLINSNSADERFRLDWVEMIVPASSSVDFDVQNLAIYDDTHLTERRFPPPPRTPVTNVGGEDFQEKKYKDVRYTQFNWEL